MSRQGSRFVRINDIYNPVIDHEWPTRVFTFMEESFGDALATEGPAGLKVDVLSRFAMGLIPKLSVPQAALLRDSLEEIGLEQPDEIETQPLKVLVKTGHLILSLAPVDQLVSLREAVSHTLRTQISLEIPPTQHFNIRLGALRDAEKSGAMIHGITDECMPPSIHLGKLVANFMFHQPKNIVN